MSRTRKYTPRVPLEHEEQCALVQWKNIYTAQYPALKMFFAIPNGGHRPIKVAKEMKAEGVRKGMPDVGVAEPMGDKHGLFIELKRLKGGRLSPEQKECIADLRERGYRVEVCYGWRAAAMVIAEYLEMEGVVI